MFVDTIKNKTTEHIDTESITDTISTNCCVPENFVSWI